MNNTPLRLADLVPVETLEQLRRLFQQITGVPMVFTDDQGVPLTELDDPTLFCGALLSHCIAGTLCLRRRKWDVPENEIEQEIRSVRAMGQPLTHRCRGGFRDAAVPIVVQEHTLGYAVFARSLTMPPDMDHFRELAIEGGMEARVGEQVARKALVMRPERIRAIADFLRIITGLVASAAYDTIRARRVLQLEELRDDLIHMIIHDLRTPLTGIIGGLQTIIDSGYDLELAREFIPMAVSGANTLVDMVSTILDVSKMEAEQVPLDCAKVQIEGLVRMALEQVQGIAAESEQRLLTQLAEACPTIEADSDKLRRVLINLLGNAVKFTPDGGTITVGSTCDPDGITIWVQDTGPGIPPEYRERIFEKYGQVDGVRTRRPSTGLGLTFCKLVAEAHGGRIWIDSAIGQGSRFSVFIPQPVPQSICAPAQK